MKLPESEYCTESSTPLQEYFFGVSDTGLIFEILRTKIYKDPVLAIAREISCNARDAHREWSMTRNDPSIAVRPVEIYLPTMFSPYLKIKDYGPGISPDRMENIFCKYAASTKRNDNIQTGGFGLGCKTPFSYSDTFNVVTIVDSVKRVYNAFIDETRVGKVQLVSEAVCDEPNGTTIIIPSKKEDFEKFTDSVISTTAYWDVRPLLLGKDPAPQFKDENKILEGSGWYITAPICDRYGYTPSSKALALIDGVQYDLDVNSIFNYDERYKADSSGVLLQTNIRINFRIGELTLSASRDNIHYDDRTKKIIKDKLDGIFAELISNIENSVKNAKTYSEACSLFNEVKNTFPAAIRNNLSAAKIIWKDQKIRQKISSDDFGENCYMTSYDLLSYVEDGMFTFKQTRKSYSDLAWPTSFLNGSSKIFYHDFAGRKDNANARISRILIQHLFDQDENLKKVQLICLPPKVKDVVQKYDAELIKLLNLENINSITLTKTEKEEIRKKYPGSLKKNPKKEKDPDKVYGHNIIWGNRGGIDIGSALPFDADEEGIYVVLESTPRRITTSGHEISSSVWNNAICFLELDSANEVVAFTPQTVKELGGDWRPLWDVCQEKASEITANIDKKDFKDANNSREICAKSKLGIVSVDRQTIINNTSIKEDDELIQYMQKSSEYDELKKNISSISSLLYFLDIKDFDGYSGYSYYTKPDKNGALYKLYFKAKTKYPFLFLIDDSYYRCDLSDVNLDKNQLVYDYINSVNEKDK
jgi:hypothetical protein